MATGSNFRLCSQTIGPHVRWATLSLKTTSFVLRRPAITRFLTALSSPSLRHGAIFLWEQFQEMNSSLIPGTRQHFHYHSFLISRGSVQFVIILKTTQICKQLRKYAHTQQKKKKSKAFLFTAQCFFFPHSSAVQKMEIRRKKQQKTINRLPLLYICVYVYTYIYTVYIYIFIMMVSTWAHSSWHGPSSWPGPGPFAQSDPAGEEGGAVTLASGLCGNCCVLAAACVAAALMPTWWRGTRPERCSLKPWRCILRRPPPQSVDLSCCPGTQKGRAKDDKQANFIDIYVFSKRKQQNVLQEKYKKGETTCNILSAVQQKHHLV